MAVKIAFVGCGYVADLYHDTLRNWANTIELKGVFDRDTARLKKFCDFYNVHAYASLEAILDDDDITLVVNLTNPDQHFEISKACLEAGKHVYSEKPLALELDQARGLVDLANKKGLHIASAPASVLGEAAQTMWRAIRDGKIGRPRLVYAELDDGMVHRIGYENWQTASGARWPAHDEFQTGCTLEHAGYALTWLAAMFGPARRVVSFSSLLVDDKGIDTPKAYTTPDFSVASLVFDNGICARLTNSIIAPHNHTFQVIGETGTLELEEVWNLRARVHLKKILTSRIKRQLSKRLGINGAVTVPPVRRRRFATPGRGYPMDFALGPAETADAIANNRTPRLSGAFALHITEVSLAIQHPERFGTDYTVTTDFEPFEPMPWSQD